MTLLKFLQISLPLLWAGLVLGISFIETPLKFNAPGITLPLALGIGRIVFSALNKIEIMCGIGLIATLFWLPLKTKGFYYLLALIAGILLLQTFYLLPVLNKRALMVMAGETPPKSVLHHIYVVIEAVKIISLIMFSFLTFKRWQMKII